MDLLWVFKVSFSNREESFAINSEYLFSCTMFLFNVIFLLPKMNF